MMSLKRIGIAAICVVGCAGSSGSSTPVGIADGTDTGTPLPDGGTDSSVSLDSSDPPAPVCLTNDDCGSDICNCLGVCVPPGPAGFPPCFEDKNCGSGHYCDVCAGVCRAMKELCEPCASRKECVDDGACVDFKTGGRYCLRACVADPGCPQPGYLCQSIAGIAVKQCVPLSGLCEKPVLCEADDECAYGEICTQGKCAAGCSSDAVCADGFVCASFRCVAACDDALNPCPGEQVCENGHCGLEGGCLEPSDCDEPETYCDLGDNTCKPGCLTDFDCKSSAKQCQGGVCIAVGCTANFWCAFGEVCDFASGKCVEAEGPHCESGCDPQSDSACGGKPNMCLSLQDKDGNAVGDFCFVACGPDPANPCPQGYGCQEIQDQNGTAQGNLCIRDCTVNPI
jgi:hypothetical protein